MDRYTPFAEAGSAPVRGSWTVPSSFRLLGRVASVVGLMLVFCGFLGCSFFPGTNSAGRVRLNRPALPPIQTAGDAVQLEVFFVDRPIDDPLLGTMLWREVDQIAAIPAETRETLRLNGFQVGHVGSNPPPAVQTLLGLVADHNSTENKDAKPMVGLRKRLPPGVETEVQASDPIEACDIRMVSGQESKQCHYDQVRCMFRLKSTRLRDGWIRIDFQPEIHHGDMKVRTTSTDEGWIYQNRQNVDVRHSQQFSLTMNIGEIAIITATADQPSSMGECFFRRDENGTTRQRLLIVRIADGGTPTAAY